MPETDPMVPPGVSPDGPDATLVALARAAASRVSATEGAAVRDGDGRVYAAAPVALPSLTLTALQLAVATAAAAGARSLTAAVIASASATMDLSGYALVRDLSATAPVHLVAPDGTLMATVTGSLDG